MKNTMSDSKKKGRVRYSVAVIYLDCGCGGGCVNEAGSYMIMATDKATCEQCGNTVPIPKTAFKDK